MATTSPAVARSTVVGSLLRPEYLFEARRAVRRGEASADDVRAAEERAVLEAIEVQQAAGIEVISDGEMRRPSWVVTIPLQEGSFRAPLAGFEYLPADPGWWALWKEPTGEKVDLDRWLGSTIARQPFVTAPLRVVRDLAQDEYGFLARNAVARTKFTVPAPSWHRIFWHEDHSRAAYPTSDDLIAAVADYLRTELVPSLRALGCDYIQMDAPNYAQWHIDLDNRAAFEAAGHDAAHELEADVEFDNSVFDGVEGITRAIHICRGNAPEGRFLASGGYEAISRQVFPRLSNYDTLLLEYDTDRAGGFEPLDDVLEHHSVVLGLVTTKAAKLEADDVVENRVRQASRYVPLDRLALSPQCGFASGATAHTMTLDEQAAKLHLIGRVARTIWGG